ncbi:MAG: LLM class F420-dependent oxidoreductase [Acidimicrobiia bacterium]|nr:LLM class F420-dependent oxidoreductase [Acidimicrobiia bacterium]
MELAFSPTSPGVDAADLVDLSVEAEHLGYRSVWTAEVGGPDAFSLLGAVAARTTTVDLGVAVVPSTTRTATLLAMSAASVSQLAGGRSVGLGLGASSRVIVERWHGAEFDPPLTRVRESVEAVRALLGGEREYHGSTTQAASVRLTAPPAGPVPLFVGALGPGMLRLAGAIGDGVCLNLMPADAVPDQLAEIRAGAEEAGRTLPDDFGVVARFHVVPCDDPAEGRGFVRQAFGPYFAQPVYNRFLAWCGYPEEAEAIADGFASGDRQAVATALHDELVDAITPIGPAGRIRDALEPFAEAGIGVAALSINAAGATAVGSALRDLAP